MNFGFFLFVVLLTKIFKLYLIVFGHSFKWIWFVCGRSSSLKIGTGNGEVWWWWKHVTLSHPHGCLLFVYHLSPTHYSSKWTNFFWYLLVPTWCTYIFSLFLSLSYPVLWAHFSPLFNNLWGTLSAPIYFSPLQSYHPKVFFSLVFSFFPLKYLQFASSFMTVIIQWSLVYRDLCASITIHAHGFSSVLMALITLTLTSQENK